MPGERDVDAVGLGVDQVEHRTGVAVLGVAVGPQRAAQPTHDDRRPQALADHVTEGDQHPP